MIARIEESGLYFDPPPQDFFRWQDCAYFRETFKRYGVMEMDFGWREADGETLTLLELKDFTKASTTLDAYIEEFVGKATDCVLLLIAIWKQMEPHSERLGECVPPAWRAFSDTTKLRLLFVIKAPPARVPGLQSLQDALRNKIQGRLELFGLRKITKVSLLDHEAAAEIGIPIEPVEPPRGRRR